jgi:hypothetical protein
MEDYKNLYYIRKEALEKARLNHDHKERIRIYEEQTIYNPTDHTNIPEIIKNFGQLTEEIQLNI